MVDDADGLLKRQMPNYNGRNMFRAMAVRVAVANDAGKSVIMW